MPRGRRPNAPSQAPNGSWYCHHPGLRRKVRLGATTFSEAVAEQQSFYGVADEPTTTSAPVPGNPVSKDGNPGDLAFKLNGGDLSLNLDDDQPVLPTAEPKKASSAADLLSSWSKSTATVETPTPVQQPSAPATPPAAHPYAYTPPAKAIKPQKGLTPEQSAKIANGLKKMVVNTNIVVMATAVQMFGRVPAPLDDDEIALLQMGWEMWLDEMFAKAKLKPVHLVLVGNLMIAVSMWASGKPKEKPKADPKAAPGHGSVASVTPISPPKG